LTIYHYTAIRRDGRQLVGEMDAASRHTVLETLHKLGHLPVEVAETKARRQGSSAGGISLFSGKPSSRQITLFTRELAMLIKAGLPLDQALTLLQNEAGSPKLARLIGQIVDQINSGKSLHEALEAQGDAFPPIYGNMVRVAEASGTLDAVLTRIAQTREQVEKLKSKTLSEMLYPCMLIVIAIGAVTVMLTFVVPRFKEMIVQAGTEVPAGARFVIGASDWLVANGVYLAVALCGAVVAILFAWQRGVGRRAIETVLLRAPLLGSITRLSLTIRFCRMFGMLIENGVELPAAMKLVRDAIGNRYAASVIDEAHDALRKGRSFLEPMSQSGIFPPVVINMLRVGEETGGLATSAFHMADMFEAKLETLVQRAFTILEPLIIILVSVFISGIIISILGAVISINDLAI
jgi:type II secretory pathway component PulF